MAAKADEAGPVAFGGDILDGRLPGLGVCDQKAPIAATACGLGGDG